MNVKTLVRGVFALSLSVFAVAQDRPYQVEEIPMPKGIAPEIGGLGFTPSGRLVVLTRRSGVLTTKPEGKPEGFQWKVFSDQSLHNANGLFVTGENEVLVSQMPELTRLKDTDGDGVADVYETVAPFSLSGAYHEVTAGPVPDGKGGWFVALNTASHSGFTFEHTRGLFSEVSRRGRNFASVPYRGWVVRISKEGVMEPYAKGFRSPNGIGVEPDGSLWVTDNQGDFRSTNPLYFVEKDKFYGHPSSLVWDPAFVAKDAKRDPLKEPMAALDAMRETAAIEFPYGFSRSPAEPMALPKDGRFGPFGGQLLVADAAAPRIIRVMVERVGGVVQGACTDFYSNNGLRNGSNRMALSPEGNVLYVGQTMREWAGAMEGLQRIIYDGKPVFAVSAMRLVRGGFELEFTQPVDPIAGPVPNAFGMESYAYKYDSNYGGPEVGLAPVKISEVEWNADRTRVRMKVPGLEPGKQYRFNPVGFSSRGMALSHGPTTYTVKVLNASE